jgi:hypothetical protein
MRGRKRATKRLAKSYCCQSLGHFACSHLQGGRIDHTAVKHSPTVRGISGRGVRSSGQQVKANEGLRCCCRGCGRRHRTCNKYQEHANERRRHACFVIDLPPKPLINTSLIRRHARLLQFLATHGSAAELNGFQGFVFHDIAT